MVIRRTRRPGLSLVEVIVSISLISILALTTINASTGWSRRRSQTSRHSDAIRLMDQFMAEIAVHPFEDHDSPTFGLETGETTRTDFDDIDDYHGFAVASPSDRGGTTISYATDWQLSVAVLAVTTDATGTLSAGTNNSNLRQIQIIATDPEGQTYEANRLVAKTQYEASAEVRTWMGQINLNVNGVTEQKVVPMMNQPLGGSGF